MRRPLEVLCPHVGYAVVARPWFRRRSRPPRCSGCGAAIPDERHAVIRLVSGTLAR